MRERRGRREQGAYLVEGVTLLLEALVAGVIPRLVLRDDSRLSADHRAALDVALARHSGYVQRVAPAVLRAVAETETPQGVVAVLPLPPAAALDSARSGDLVLIADGVQDPGNLGTMLRTAEGVGAWGVVTTPGTVDLFNSKVVRAAMGAHYRLRLAPELTWPSIVSAIGGRLPLLGTDATAHRRYDEQDWTRGGALVIGGEAGGLSLPARAVVDDLIAIPLVAPVESLNAAVAAAVILFEAARQRRSGPRPAPEMSAG